MIDGYSEDETLERVHDLLDKAADVMAACLAEGLVESREPIFCAGGSQYFDLVPQRLRRKLPSAEVCVLIRAGGYLFHGSGWYAAKFARADGGRLFSQQPPRRCWQRCSAGSQVQC